MSIAYDEKNRTITLHTKNTTYQMQIDLQIPHVPLELLLVVAHGEGGAAQQLPLRGEGELLVVVDEQPGPVVVLQILDMLGHRRLGDVQAFRRPGVVSAPAHLQKGVHPKVQHRPPPFPVFYSILHFPPLEKGNLRRRFCI